MSGLVRHPLNQGFDWAASFAGPPASAVARDYRAHGYCLLPGLLEPHCVTQLAEAIDPLEAGIGPSRLTMADGSRLDYPHEAMSFTRNLVLHSPVVRAVITAPLFGGLAADLLGCDSVRLYWDQAVYKKPGAAAPFPWHQDIGYTFTDPQHYLTVWIALAPATLANGCPWVLPDVQHLGALAHEWRPEGLAVRGLADDPVDAAGNPLGVPCPLEPGDAVAFSSLTPHRTGANLTTSPRKGLIVQYAPAHIAHVDENAARTPQNDARLNPLVCR